MKNKHFNLQVKTDFKIDKCQEKKILIGKQ